MHDKTFGQKHNIFGDIMVNQMNIHAKNVYCIQTVKVYIFINYPIISYSLYSQIQQQNKNKITNNDNNNNDNHKGYDITHILNYHQIMLHSMFYNNIKLSSLIGIDVHINKNTKKPCNNCDKLLNI